jgi:hypothetical protein
MLKTEGLVLQSMFIGYVGVGCKAKGCVISINMVGVEGSEAICSVRLRLYKASKAKRFGGEIRKVIKGMGRNNIRKLRYEGRRRWDCILGIGCSVTSV